MTPSIEVGVGFSVGQGGDNHDMAIADDTVLVIGWAVFLDRDE